MSSLAMCSIMALLLAIGVTARPENSDGIAATITTNQPDAPWFCHGIDCPPFSVEDGSVGDDMELRNYPAGQWVSTNVSEVKYDEAVGTGFMRLFKYISGANQGDQKIAMTAPVKVLAIPGEGPYCESHFTISFYVPLDLQGAAPQPTAPEVFINNIAAGRFFVYSYSGYSPEKKMLGKLADALTILDSSRYNASYDASYFYSAGYDSPFHIINRHNEVWIPAM